MRRVQQEPYNCDKRWMSADTVLIQSEEGQAHFLTEVFGGSIMDVITFVGVSKAHLVLPRWEEHRGRIKDVEVARCKIVWEQ